VIRSLDDDSATIQMYDGGEEVNVPTSSLEIVAPVKNDKVCCCCRCRYFCCFCCCRYFYFVVVVFAIFVVVVNFVVVTNLTGFIIPVILDDLISQLFVQNELVGFFC